MFHLSSKIHRKVLISWKSNLNSSGLLKICRLRWCFATQSLHFFSWLRNRAFIEKMKGTYKGIKERAYKRIPYLTIRTIYNPKELHPVDNYKKVWLRDTQYDPLNLTTSHTSSKDFNSPLKFNYSSRAILPPREQLNKCMTFPLSRKRELIGSWCRPKRELLLWMKSCRIHQEGFYIYRRELRVK